jgi:hypothetical protein
MKLIKLTKGYFAKVDDEDFEYLNQFKWCVQGNGRYVRRLSGYKQVLMHRFIMQPENGMVVDHLNGDGLDNRRCNLRVATPSQNGANRKSIVGNSKYIGVHKLKNGTFLSYIKKNYKRTSIGVFNSEEKAAKAYNIKALELFGEFATLNKIENEESIILDNKHDRSIIVNQFSSNNELINTFKSMTEASIITGVQASKISLCCNGKRKTTGGFKWGYNVSGLVAVGDL